MTARSATASREIDGRGRTSGKAYDEFRAALMVRNNEGPTKAYNRFHDPEEASPDILRLRTLHAAMDRAVLDAYGWTDIPTDCKFLLDYEEDDENGDAASSAGSGGGQGRKKRKPYRYRWPDAVRDDVLARLLALNVKRAEEEKLRGTEGDPGGGSSKKRPKKPRIGNSRDVAGQIALGDGEGR